MDNHLNHHCKLYDYAEILKTFNEKKIFSELFLWKLAWKYVHIVTVTDIGKKKANTITLK